MKELLLRLREQRVYVSLDVRAGYFKCRVYRLIPEPVGGVHVEDSEKLHSLDEVEDFLRGYLKEE